MKTLNTSLKYHFLVGAFLSVWVFILAIVARPFEHGNPDFRTWLYASIGFGVLVFLCYTVMSIIQKQVYEKLKAWNLLLEIISYILFYVAYSILSYEFYMSSLLNGIYSFFEFVTKVILPSALIFVPIMILARKYLIKLLPDKEEVLTINGENKLDVLKIKKSQLIAISNAQNYVEVFFVQNNELKSKLIRGSLKKMQNELDFLLQVHRSHLINPNHFTAWKNSTTISLTYIELPVSKTYKPNLEGL